MYGQVKSWDNRKEVKDKRLGQQCVNGRMWTRRVRWMESGVEGQPIKLKFEDGERYEEMAFADKISAQTAWQRFKDGATIEDCASIFKVSLAETLKSRRAAGK